MGSLRSWGDYPMTHGSNSRAAGRIGFHQGMRLRPWKNPPDGPSSGSVASQTGVSAPSSTVPGAFGPPMSVLIHPGQHELINTPSCLRASASISVTAFSAAFETRYDG